MARPVGVWRREGRGLVGLDPGVGGERDGWRGIVGIVGFSRYICK